MPSLSARTRTPAGLPAADLIFAASEHRSNETIEPGMFEVAVFDQAAPDFRPGYEIEKVVRESTFEEACELAKLLAFGCAVRDNSNDVEVIVFGGDSNSDLYTVEVCR